MQCWGLSPGYLVCKANILAAVLYIYIFSCFLYFLFVLGLHAVILKDWAEIIPSGAWDRMGCWALTGLASCRAKALNCFTISLLLPPSLLPSPPPSLPLLLLLSFPTSSSVHHGSILDLCLGISPDRLGKYRVLVIKPESAVCPACALPNGFSSPALGKQSFFN